MHKHIIPYSATLAVAVSSIVTAFSLGWAAIPVAIIYFLIGRHCLQLGLSTNAEEDRFKKGAESIALLGLVIFLPLIFTLGVTTAILVLVAFVQLGLNLQTFSKKQFYLGVVLSFALITFCASESRDGSFLLFFIPYVLFLCATLFSLSVERLELGFNQWLKNSGLLLLLTFMIYLLLPRFSPLLLGATPGSDHYYYDKGWVDKAEQGVTDGRSLAHEGESHAADYGEMGESSIDAEMGTVITESQSGAASNNQGTSNKQGTSSSNSRGVGQGFYGHSRQRLNKDVVMQVRSDAPLYLTTEILDRFDGLGWHATLNNQDYIQPTDSEFKLAHIPNLGQATSSYHYEVEVVATLPEQIPLAWQPQVANFPAQALKLSETYTLSAPSQLKPGTAYSGKSQFHILDGRVAYVIKESNLAPYLQLPNNVDIRIYDLANSVTAHTTNALQQAILLEEHLREEYAYSLDTIIRDQNRTDLSEFLFDTKFGHCEYFASAHALMLRLKGIPSRVVNGYAATDRNPLTGFIEVRGTDAHAWTEGYFDGIGWVPFEPTSYYQLPSAEPEMEMTYEQLNDYVDRQLEILAEGDGEWSMQSILLGVYQALSTFIGVVAVSIKWFFLAFGHWLLAATVVLVLLWRAWIFLKPKWAIYRLKKQADRFQLSHTIADYTFWMTHISNGLRLQERPLPWSTVNDFVNAMLTLKLAELDDGFTVRFNALAYGPNDNVKLSVEPSDVEADINTLIKAFNQSWLLL